MKNRGGMFTLALIVALVYALIAGFYLVPGVYHPFSSDTIDHTTPHLTLSAIFGALALLTLLMGQLSRPKDRTDDR
ncbi:MAG: hypothetical protein ACLQUY_06845 [Ktedonobacterales bacterium]